MFAVLRLHQMPVGPGGIAIADDDIGRNEFAVGQFHATGTPVLHADAGDRRAVADGHTTPFKQFDQLPHDGTRAAHGRVHAPAPLQRVNERIHASDRVRIATDQQRVKTHDDTQLGVLDVLGH